MKIEDIVTDGLTDNATIIAELKIRSGKAPDIKKIQKQLDPKQHDINDTILYPDRKVYKLDKSGSQPGQTFAANPNPTKNLPGVGANQATTTGNAGTPVFDRWEKINRIALSLQKLIVSRAVSFSVGNPIIRTYSGDLDEDYKAVRAALERVLDDNNEVKLNKQVARAIYSSTEVAEYWFAADLGTKVNKEGQIIKKQSTKYGFKTGKKVKAMIFSPLDGMKLYPKKDVHDKMVCFSREFSITSGTDTISYFETFTDEQITLFTNSNKGGGWIRADVDIPYGKMPIVYGSQPQTEYDDVNVVIDRLELLLSKWGDINNYNMGPKHFINGKVTSWGSKGDTGTVIQGDKDTKYEIISWDHAPESIKSEIEALLKFIFSLTQTPDISFDNLKTLGNISGVALKLLFMDAHLKVMDKEEIFVDYLKRRDKIVCSILGYLDPNEHNGAYDDIDIKHALDPFMIADDKEQIEITLLKNGNQPVESQEKSVADWGGDEAEYEKIKQEEADRALTSITQPTF